MSESHHESGRMSLAGRLFWSLVLAAHGLVAALPLVSPEPFEPSPSADPIFTQQPTDSNGQPFTTAPIEVPKLRSKSGLTSPVTGEK